MYYYYTSKIHPHHQNEKYIITIFDLKNTAALCLKITEKVSFNIASEASYVYILSGQKLIKNAKSGPFWRIFENLNRTKIGEKFQNSKIQMRHFG